MLGQQLRRPVIVASLLCLGLLGDACSGSSPVACPNDYPSTCPDGASTFAAEVAPLMQGRCAYCHSQAPRQLLRNYTEIRDAGHVVLMQLVNCTMPPAPTPPLTADERRVILSWFACGAMDN